jgi:hypothetical protein
LSRFLLSTFCFLLSAFWHSGILPPARGFAVCARIRCRGGVTAPTPRLVYSAAALRCASRG